MRVDEAPRDVDTLAADALQARTWYAGGANKLWRTLNDGSGWEVCQLFAETETIWSISVNKELAGCVAVATREETDNGITSYVYVSRDCGESWEKVDVREQTRVEQMAWVMRDKVPVLLLATDSGLHELADPKPGVSSRPILVTSRNQALGFWAVVSERDIAGNVVVAVAAQRLDPAKNDAAVYVSWNVCDSSMTDAEIKFRPMRKRESDNIRVLHLQRDGSRMYLWAGQFVDGSDPGKGCWRMELHSFVEDSPDDWKAYEKGWALADGRQGAGSCRAIITSGGTVFVASHRGGVMRLNPNVQDPVWERPNINSGLPLRALDEGRLFAPVLTLATDPRQELLLAGVGQVGRDNPDEGAIENPGLYLCARNAVAEQAPYVDWTFTHVSAATFTDRVTLPENWLFVSGTHDITVVSEHEAQRD